MPEGGHRRRGKVVDAARLTAEAAMVAFAALFSALSEIPDPRRPQGRRYPLAHLLLFSVLAVLAGATSYRGILTFIGVHRARLNTTFGTRLRRAPAVNTLRNLFLVRRRIQKIHQGWRVQPCIPAWCLGSSRAGSATA